MSSLHILPCLLFTRWGVQRCSAGLLLFSALSCESAKIDMEGLSCDAQGRCASGYECWQGSCVASNSEQLVDATEPSTPEPNASEESASNDTADNSNTSEESVPHDGALTDGTITSASDPGSATETEANVTSDTEFDSSGISDAAFAPEPSASSSDVTSGTEDTERESCLDAAAPDSGVCTKTCEPPLLLCGARCIDPQVDPLHCGQCGLLCEAPRLGSAVCVAGTCQQLCVEGWMVCDGRCTDVTSRRQDCGACGNRCPDNTKCVDSLCQ